MRKVFDITTVGSATIDLFFIDGRLPIDKNRLNLAFGGKYQTYDFAESLGGGGLNTAVGFARLGFKTAYAGEVSQDWLGEEIIKRLKNEKVDTSYILRKPIKPSVSAVLLGKNGERTIISYISQGKETLSFNKFKEAIKSSHWLFFSDHKSERRQKLDFLENAKEAKTKIAISLGGEELKKGISHNENYLKISNVFILNAHELAGLVKRRYEDLDLKNTNYANIFKTNLLIVTDSKNGEYAFVKNKMYYRKPYPNGKIIDTTGAGDAFAIGFLAGYIKGLTIEGALDLGSRNAVSVIQKLGAQSGLLYKKDVRTILYSQ